MNIIQPTDTKVLLEASSLSISFEEISAVDNISFTIAKGEILALAGESGCGKSVTCLSLAGLLDKSVCSVSGAISLSAQDKKYKINDASKKDLLNIRGSKIAYIFQDPSSSLNPVFKIKEQLREAINLHNSDIDNPEEKALELLTLVGLSAPRYRLNSYPCQLSGGMLQRVMIAMALAGNPELLVADEPTTALDVTVQAQIIELIKEINIKTGMSVLLVTHNLGIVAQLADRVMIMYAGHIVESAPLKQIFETPLHPYTRALLSSSPSLGRGKTRLQTIRGSVSSFTKEYNGCRFAQRCTLREKLTSGTEKCISSVPDDIYVDNSHFCKCHFFDKY